MGVGQIIDLLIQGEKEAQEQLWFIPSENLPSPFTRLALATSSVNRYFFQYLYQDQRFCPGTEIYQRLYDHCVERLKQLLDAQFVSLKPLSGMVAMTMVITAHTQKDDLFLALAPELGGHTHTGNIANLIGRRLAYIPMRDDGQGWMDVDYDQLAEDIRRLDARLLYLDPMSYLYTFDLERLRRITPESCRLHYDISHVMAFVAGGAYPNALHHGFNAIGGSTHKTLPAVQKAYFATNSEELFDYFHTKAGQLISSYHTSSILALAVTLEETLEFYPRYAKQIIDNTLGFAEMLRQRGFTLLGRRATPSECHVLFVNMEDLGDQVEACHRLAACNLITHPMLLPGLERKPGLRLGLQELTLLGMGPAELEQVADVFKAVVIDRRPPEKYAAAMAELRSRFQWPVTSYQDQERMQRLVDLLQG